MDNNKLMADKHYYREMTPMSIPDGSQNYCHKVYGPETGIIRPSGSYPNMPMECNQYREPNTTETFTEVWHSLFFPATNEPSTTTSIVTTPEIEPTVVEPKPFLCNICDYRCSQKRRMENHMDSVHKNIKNFKCNQCEYRCTERYMLTVHDNAVHKKLRPHKCPECERRFNEKKKMVRHINEVHRKVKNFKCQTCGFEFYSKEGLRRHVNGVHLKLKPYKCIEAGCKFESGERNHLIRHVNVTHRKIKPFKCDSCEYRCGYKINLVKHVDRLHKKLTADQSNISNSTLPTSSRKFFKCSFCSHTERQAYEMYNHIITLHQELSNPDQKSNSTPPPQKHQIKVHKCEHCDYRGTKSRLIDHSNAVHKKIKPHKCEFCDAQFSEKNMLTRHIKTVHLKLKPYACSSCDYKASRKKSLADHIDRIHKKLRPFKCDECDYAGSKKVQLTNHINAIHKDFRPFGCDFCDYKSVRKDQLIKHVDANHIKENKEVSDIHLESQIIDTNVSASVINENRLEMRDIIIDRGQQNNTTDQHESGTLNNLHPNVIHDSTSLSLQEASGAATIMAVHHCGLDLQSTNLGMESNINS